MTILQIFKCVLLLSLFGLLQSAHAEDAPLYHGQKCGLALPCDVGERSYHARLPDNWDGETPLPVLLHFHGWGRQGKMIMNHRRIAGATRKLGVMLLAPNGQGRSWNFWNEDTNDIGFAEAVLKDAAKRWPIDDSRIYVSGYSYGSAMAWRFACNSKTDIHTLLAISGTLHHAEQSCHTPVNVRHVHGTSDTVMHYPFGENEEVEEAVSLWLNRNECAAKADQRSLWQAVKILQFDRHQWSRCSSGKNVILDVHKRGHFIPRFWIERQLQDLL